MDLLRFQTREIADAQLDRIDEQALEDDYRQAPPKFSSLGKESLTESHLQLVELIDGLQTH